MKVKKYTGETMQDVVFQVKADLGPEAVIISKRKIKEGGIFGFFAKESFELIAVLENKNLEKTAAAENNELDAVEISKSAFQNQNNSFKDKDIQKTAAADPENKNAIKEFISDLKSDTALNQADFKNKSQQKIKNAELAELKKKEEKETKKQPESQQKNLNQQRNNKFRDYLKQKKEKEMTAEERLQNKFQNENSAAQKKQKKNNSTDSNQLYNYLLAQGVESRNLNLFLKSLDNNLIENKEEDFEFQLQSFLNDYFAANSPIKLDLKQKIISFVGPTGVGKTTTMAKVAADFAVNQNKKVALITADTYRIAAVEQLQTYSKIIDIPFAVCYSGAKLNQMISGKFSSCDLILIDTPGSSWKDDLQLDRLKDFVDRSFVDEVHLLLSLNTKSSDLRSVVNKFAALKADKVLYTKLDETSSYGDIINIKENYDLPVSYLSCGQDVPEDLEIASSEKIFKYLFGDLYE